MDNENQAHIPPPPSTPTTEFDYANRLEQAIGATKTVGSRWFHYDKSTGTWREGTSHIHRPKALNVYPPHQRSEMKAQRLLRHLESRWQCSIDDFKGALTFTETGDVLINMLNGILEVTPTTIKLRPHDAGHFFTRCLNVPYNPDAPCPLYQRVLVECLPDEADRELFLLCLGNFLLPDCRFEVCLVCYGDAGSGKSTLAEPVTLIMGTGDDGLLTRLSMGQICDPKSYSLPKLNYACVNLGTELQSIEVDESANYKTLVSGEPIEARPIYDRPFTMRPHCKLWFLANNLPRFKNGTEAELRRTRFLRFESKPSKPDVTLKKRVGEEAEGVLVLMVQHLQRLLSLERIPTGGAHSQAVHVRFQVSNDPLGTFIRRHCTLSPTSEALKTDLANSFASYCELHSLPTKINDAFFKQLYEREPSVIDERVTRDGKRVHLIKGLALRPDAPSEVLEQRLGAASTLPGPAF